MSRNEAWFNHQITDLQTQMAVLTTERDEAVEKFGQINACYEDMSLDIEGGKHEIATLTADNEALKVELAKAKKELQGWSDRRSAHAAAAISGGR